MKLHRHQGFWRSSAQVDAERTRFGRRGRSRVAALKTDGCLGMALIKISNTWRGEWGGVVGAVVQESECAQRRIANAMTQRCDGEWEEGAEGKRLRLRAVVPPVSCEGSASPCVKTCREAQRIHPTRVVAGVGSVWRASAHKGCPVFRRRAPELNTTAEAADPDRRAPAARDADRRPSRARRRTRCRGIPRKDHAARADVGGDAAVWFPGLFARLYA